MSVLNTKGSPPNYRMPPLLSFNAPSASWAAKPWATMGHGPQWAICHKPQASQTTGGPHPPSSIRCY
jgi:hypothetical protein